MSVDFTGAQELVKDLVELQDDVLIRVERKGVRQALKPTRDAARNNAPHLSGALRKGIQLSVRLDKPRHRILGQVKSTAPHTHLIEYGHKVKPRGRAKKRSVLTPPRKTKKQDVQGLSFVPARPFLRPALDATKDNWVPSLISSIREEVNKRNA